MGEMRLFVGTLTPKSGYPWKVTLLSPNADLAWRMIGCYAGGAQEVESVTEYPVGPDYEGLVSVGYYDKRAEERLFGERDDLIDSLEWCVSNAEGWISSVRKATDDEAWEKVRSRAETLRGQIGWIIEDAETLLLSEEVE